MNKELSAKLEKTIFDKYAFEAISSEVLNGVRQDVIDFLIEHDTPFQRIRCDRVLNTSEIIDSNCIIFQVIQMENHEEVYYTYIIGPAEKKFQLIERFI